MSKIVYTAILENISTRSDGTIKLTLGCNEMGSSDAGILFQLRNKYLKCLMSDNNISPVDENILVETQLQDGKKVKSKSQRLRAVLFRVWEQSGIPIEFDDFYNTEMEKIIEHFKTKLE